MSKHEISATNAFDHAADPSSTLWFTLNELRFNELKVEIANSNATPDCSETDQGQLDLLTDQLNCIATEVSKVKAETLLALRTKALILEEYLEEDAPDVLHDLVISICRDLHELCYPRPVSAKAGMPHQV